MKDLLKLSASALACFMVSCGPPPPPSAHFLSASSGAFGSFSSTGSLVTTGGASGAKVWITGRAASGAKMDVILNPYSGVTGTFPFSGISNTGCQYTSPAGDTIRVSVHGSISLTAVTPNMVGTFTFTAADSSVISGSFDAPAP